MTTKKSAEAHPAQGDGARKEEALLCLSLFVHRCLVTIYGDLNLDLVSLSLLDEIARHNLEPPVQEGHMAFPRGAGEMKRMRGCNAFSLSQATGAPRETVRRKIKQLAELGWVEQRNRKGLFITTRWTERLSRTEVATLLGELRETARRVDVILHG